MSNIFLINGVLLNKRRYVKEKDIYHEYSYKYTYDEKN